MDNAGDWLYIVLIVIAGISSLIGSVRKKQEHTATGQPPSFEEEAKEQPSPEKKFREILQEEIRKKQSYPPSAPVSGKPAKRYGIQTPVEEGIPSLEQLFIEEDILSAPGQEILNNPDELKKAVIYTEIFNRKY